MDIGKVEWRITRHFQGRRLRVEERQEPTPYEMKAKTLRQKDSVRD